MPRGSHERGREEGGESNAIPDLVIKYFPTRFDMALCRFTTLYASAARNGRETFDSPSSFADAKVCLKKLAGSPNNHETAMKEEKQDQ